MRGHSPRHLPDLIAAVLGPRAVREIADADPGSPDAHHGLGLWTRNKLRKLGLQWTDQDLDDCWHALVCAAARRTR